MRGCGASRQPSAASVVSDRDVGRGAGLLPEQRDEAGVVEPNRIAPVGCHLRRFAREAAEDAGDAEQPPRQAPDAQRAAAGPADGFHHPGAVLVVEALELKHLERAQALGHVHEPREGLGEVGKVGPAVPATARRVDDAAERPARRDHRLREPARARPRAEEVAGAQDQRRDLRRGVPEALLEGDADRALAALRLLGAVGVDDRRCRGVEVVDRAREHDARAARRPRRRDRVVDHRQDEPVPVRVVGRVHRVHDDRGARRRADDVGAHHGVALDPVDAGRTVPARGRGGAGHAAHLPAVAQKRRGDTTADATRGAQHQRRPVPFHRSLLISGRFDATEMRRARLKRNCKQSDR